VELVEQVDRRGGAEELAHDRGEPHVAPIVEERLLAASRPDDPQQPARPVRAAENELAAGVLDLALARLLRRGKTIRDLPPDRPQALRGLGHLRDLLLGEEVLEDEETIVIETMDFGRGQLVRHNVGGIIAQTAIPML